MEPEVVPEEIESVVEPEVVPEEIESVVEPEVVKESAGLGAITRIPNKSYPELSYHLIVIPQILRKISPDHS